MRLKYGTQRAITNQKIPPMSGIEIKKMMLSFASMAIAAIIEPTESSGQRVSWRTPKAMAS